MVEFKHCRLAECRQLTGWTQMSEDITTSWGIMLHAHTAASLMWLTLFNTNCCFFTDRSYEDIVFA